MKRRRDSIIHTHKSIENSKSLPPFTTLSHATSALTFCNPIQTSSSSSSSSSRLLLSDDCMCNPSHNIKIRCECRDSHFLILIPIPVTPTSQRILRNQMEQFLKPQLQSRPKILTVEVGWGSVGGWGRGHSSYVRGNYMQVSLQQTKHESQSQLDAQCHLWICNLKCIVRDGALDTLQELLPLQTVLFLISWGQTESQSKS